MKTYKQLIETSSEGQLDLDTGIKEEGLYISVVPDKESLQKLSEFCKRNFGKVDLEDIHCTLMYSEVGIARGVALKFSKPRYIAYADYFEYWEGHDKAGYLVLKLRSEELEEEHSRLKVAGCKPTYDIYSPHITIVTPIDKEEGEKKVLIGNAGLSNKLFKLVLCNEKLDILRK